MKRTFLLAALPIAIAATLFVCACNSHRGGEQQSGINPSPITTVPDPTPTKVRPEPIPCGTISESSGSEEETDKVIRNCVLAKVGEGATYIEDVSVGPKKYYTDAVGTTWIGFVISSIPVDSADHAYGVLKEVAEGRWALVSLATAGWTVPSDVAKAFGLAPY